MCSSDNPDAIFGLLAPPLTNIEATVRAVAFSGGSSSQMFRNFTQVATDACWAVDNSAAGAGILFVKLGSFAKLLLNLNASNQPLVKLGSVAILPVLLPKLYQILTNVVLWQEMLSYQPAVPHKTACFTVLHKSGSQP